MQKQVTRMTKKQILQTILKIGNDASEIRKFYASYFLGKSAVWYSKNGEYRDTKIELICLLIANGRGVIRDTGIQLALEQPTHMLAKIIRHLKKTDGYRLPNKFKTAVIHRYMTMDKNRLYRDVLRSKKELKYIIKALRMRPGRELQDILFRDIVPEDTVLSAVKELAKTSSQKRAAELIEKYKIPYASCIGAIGHLQPVGVDLKIALIDTMSPAECVNLINSLLDGERCMDVVLAVYDKLESAIKDERISTSKLKVAAEILKSAGYSKANRLIKKLENAYSERIKAKGEIDARVAIIIDVSASMESAIEAARPVADMIARMCKYEPTIVAHNEDAWFLAREDIPELKACNCTSMGRAVRLLKNDDAEYDYYIFITDECENTYPYAKDEIETLSYRPHVVIINTEYDDKGRLYKEINKLDINISWLCFKGRHYNLTDLANIINPRQLDEILREITDIQLTKLEKRVAPRPQRCDKRNDRGYRGYKGGREKADGHRHRKHRMPAGGGFWRA